MVIATTEMVIAVIEMGIAGTEMVIAAIKMPIAASPTVIAAPEMVIATAAMPIAATTMVTNPAPPVIETARMDIETTPGRQKTPRVEDSHGATQTLRVPPPAIGLRWRMSTAHYSGNTPTAMTNETLPKCVFIDTSVWEDLNFDCSSRLIRDLRARIEVGEVRLVSSEITRREVWLRMQSHVTTAKEGLAKAANLKCMFDAEALTLLDSAGKHIQIEKMRQPWDEFLIEARAVVLPTNASDVQGVFDAFFSSRPPFGGQNKKCEFPDAFVLASLRSYARESDCKIDVLSSDGDFENACKNDLRLRHFKSLAEWLSLLPSKLHPCSVDLCALMEQHRCRESLENAIAQAFGNRGFFWTPEDEWDAEVVETFDKSVPSWNVFVAKVDDGWAEVIGDATVVFKARATYPDPSMTYKDHETKNVVSLGNVGVVLSSTSRLPISFKINMKKLRLGQIEIDDLDLDRFQKVWIADYTVESVHNPTYD